MASAHLSAKQLAGTVLVLTAALGALAYLWWYQIGPFVPPVPGEMQAPPLRGLALQQITVGQGPLSRAVVDFQPPRPEAPPAVLSGAAPVLGTARPGETPERRFSREMAAFLTERLQAGGVPFRPLEPGVGLVKDFDALSVAVLNAAEGEKTLFQVKVDVRRTVFLVGQRLPSEARFPLLETPLYRVPKGELLPRAAETIRAMADQIVDLYKAQNAPPAPR